MLDIVENDFNIVKYDNDLLSVEEANTEVEVYDSSLALIADEFNYMEILGND